MQNDQENQQQNQDNQGLQDNTNAQPSETPSPVEIPGLPQTPSPDSQTPPEQPQVPAVDNSQVPLADNPQAAADVQPQTGQQTAEPLTTPPSGGKSPKMLIVGLIVLALAIIAGGVFFFLQLRATQDSEQPPTDTQELTTPPTVLDPTEGWEVYSGTAFSVKYPGELIIGQDDGMLNISRWGPTQTEGTELFDGYAINFTLIENAQLTPQEYTQTLIDELEEAGVSQVIQGPEQYVLNEYIGVSYVEEGLGTFRNIVLASEDESLLVLISVIVADPGNLGFQDTVDLILSTFTFVNPNQDLIVACEQAGGSWLSEYNECESQASDMGLDEVMCQSLGGEYTECHSPCRHYPGYPDDVICPAVCVRVCAF